MPKFCAGCNRLGHATLECSKFCTGKPSSLAEHRAPNLQSHQPPVRRNVARSYLQHGQSINPSSTSLIPNPSPTTTKPPAPSISAATVNTTSTTSECPPIISDAVNSCLRQPSTALVEGSSYPTMSQLPSNHNTSMQPSRHISRHKTKKVSFGGTSTIPQSNLTANSEYWLAVNCQVAIIEQDCINNSSNTPPNHPPPVISIGMNITIPSSNRNPSSSNHSGDEASGSSVGADSPISSTRDITHLPQHVSAGRELATYDSEGDERPIEPSQLQGHNTDELLDKMLRSSKRNKRHPDQPLKV